MNAAAPRFLFIFRSGPAAAPMFLEALDMVLTVAAFDHCVRLLFVDEGVRHLCADLTPASPQQEQAQRMIEVLDLYEVREVLVGRESLHARGLSERDCRIAVTALREASIPGLIADHERVQVIG